LVITRVACKFPATAIFSRTCFNGAVLAWEVPGGVGTVRGAFLCLAGFKTGLAAKIGGIFWGAANFFAGGGCRMTAI
jgi:hypothetical protein